MAEFDSPLALLGHRFFHSLCALLIVAIILAFRFICFYVKARYQFPGPPVKNFWIGNLDQTMADDVHESVSDCMLQSWRQSNNVV